MQLAELTIPAEPEFVSLARMIVSAIATDQYDFSDDQLDDLKLAVSEACVLAMSPDSGHTVSVNCGGDAERLQIMVGGNGAFDSESLEGDALLMEPSNKAALEPNFGLPLISSLVDELTVEEHPGGDRLCLTLIASAPGDLD